MNSKHILAFWSVLVVGFALTTALAYEFYQYESIAIHSEFRSEVNDRVNRLDVELKIHLESLHNLEFLFGQDDDVTSAQFRKVAEAILFRHPDIQAIEWIPRVTDARRLEYESRRQEQYPDFEITERQEQGIMVRALPRDEYFPVYYVEPFIGNEAAFGFDLASNPRRLDALNQSRDTGKMVATASITLVQEKSNQKGILVFLPVYNSVASTMLKRRESLQGFILGVFRVGDIVEIVIPLTTANNMSMALIDNSSADSGDILYDNTASLQGTVVEKMMYEKSLADVAGRQWSVVSVPAAGYINNLRSWTHIAIVLVGLSLTLFISVYMKSVLTRSMIVESLVRSKTQELDTANEKLTMLSLSDELTGIANRRYFNEYFEREWIRGIRDTQPMTLIMLDIDYFKQYNDYYGHRAGDDCLVKVAAKLVELTQRPADLAVRYGGDEFMIVLPNTSEDALQLANECRESIENMQITHEYSNASGVVTVSIGLSTLIPDKSIDPKVLIESVDKALYRAKEQGRNRVEASCRGPEEESNHLAAG